MARIIAFVNQKGGVAKTTSAVNVGAGLALAGKKVLLVDLDPQGHMTVSLGVDAYELDNTVYELFKGNADASQAILSIDNKYDLIPSDIRLSGLEKKFPNTAHK